MEGHVRISISIKKQSFTPRQPLAKPRFALETRELSEDSGSPI